MVYVYNVLDLVNKLKARACNTRELARKFWYYYFVNGNCTYSNHLSRSK